MQTFNENWRVVRQLLPEEWERWARETNAVRRLRGFSSPEALLRTLLLHVGRGYSLRETVVQAKAAGLAEVSDVALLLRLRSAEEWLRQMCQFLLTESGVSIPATAGRPVRSVDATLVKEPGPTGSQWRLHYSLRLPALACDFFELTATKGKGAGETFRHFPVGAGELVLGDAGYCCGAGIEHVAAAQGWVVVRLNPYAVRLRDRRGRHWNLLPRLAGWQEAGQVRQWNIRVETPGGWVAGRICAIRKSEEAIAKIHRKMKRRASRDGTRLRDETLQYANYVLLFTNWPEVEASAREVLDWYRLRWQIELVFKRLKSLVQFGHLPKYDDRSSRAWLYGKLVVALLAQKLVRIGRDFSPWGYPLPEKAAE